MNFEQLLESESVLLEEAYGQIDESMYKLGLPTREDVIAIMEGAPVYIQENYKKVAKDVKAKFYTSPTGDKSFVTFTKNDIVYIEGKEKRHFKQNEWNAFEKDLLKSGYKEEKNGQRLKAWTPFVKKAAMVFGFGMVGVVLAVVIGMVSGFDNWDSFTDAFNSINNKYNRGAWEIELTELPKTRTIGDPVIGNITKSIEDATFPSSNFIPPSPTLRKQFDEYQKFERIFKNELEYNNGVATPELIAARKTLDKIASVMTQARMKDMYTPQPKTILDKVELAFKSLPEIGRRLFKLEREKDK